MTPGVLRIDGPRVVVEVAPAEQISGEDLLLDDDLLAVLELDDVLHRDDDLEDPVLHVHRDDPALEVGLHLVLVAGVGVDDVPPPGPVVRALDENDVFLVLVIVLLVRDGLLDDLLDGTDARCRLDVVERRRRQDPRTLRPRWRGRRPARSIRRGRSPGSVLRTSMSLMT